MKNILEAASNLYQSNLDLKNFAKWPDDLVSSNLLPRMIPAAKLVENFPLSGTTETNPLIEAIKANVNLMHWKRTYTEEEVGHDLYNRYGYCERLDPRGILNQLNLEVF